MAKVYALFGGAASSDNEDRLEPETPWAIFEGALTAAISEFRAHANKSGDSWSEQEFCQNDRNTYDVALLNVFNWASLHQKQNGSEIIRVQADEEGKFRLTVSRPGGYLVIAYGRAGSNEAYWAAPTNVQTGEDTDIKLSAPVKSCLDIEQ